MSSVKVVYETEAISRIREQLKHMKREELDFVEYLVGQERERRKNKVYQQFLDQIHQFKEKH